MTVLSPTMAGPIASTYDEAACASSRLEEGGAADLLDGSLFADGGTGRACSEPTSPVAAPVIIDCNDPGVSVWVGEMIGSCDMPRPATPTQVVPTAVRAAGRSAPARVCDGFRCSHESTPLRSAWRVDDDAAFATGSRLDLGVWPASQPVTVDALLAPDEVEQPRLERPPRSV
jgi:hypothetical protein